jgi:DNA-binding transcriptional LysR family regulator
MARVREAGAGRLIVGISPGIRVELLRMLLTSAEAGADVTTRSVAGYEADALLIRHHIDAALVHARPQGTGLRFVVVEDIALGVAMPSGHRLARRRTIPPAELTGEALYWLGRNSEPALYDEVMAKLGAAGYAGGGTQQSGSVDTALDLVAAGLGVSLKFRHEVVKAGRRGIVWRPLTIDVTVPTVLAWRTGDGSPLLQAFRRAAERAARGDA